MHRGRLKGQRYSYASAEEADQVAKAQTYESHMRARCARAMATRRCYVPQAPGRLVHLPPAGDIARSLLYRVVR